jgi:tRNA threonylcarbamoyladenosine biosynthesis protein TsaB
MLILALETALSRCSAALWRDGELVAERRLDLARGHSESLLPMVAKIMAESGVAFSALSRIAVTTGPGSFTGVRIGLAAARGLALACNIPAIGVTTLECVAYAAAPESKSRPILAVLDAGRPDLFAQAFDASGVARTAISASPPDQIALAIREAPFVVAGNAEARLRPLVGDRPVEFIAAVPDAAEVASLAALREPSRQMPAPVYIHPPYAKLPESK